MALALTLFSVSVLWLQEALGPCQLRRRTDDPAWKNA
jgi:hypothetical protein